MIKSFKGLIGHDSQVRIKLSTPNGLTGYKMKKFQLMGPDLAGEDQEATVKIFSVEQSTITDDINFNDPLLLAVGFFENENAVTGLGGSIIMFDNVTINQDIYLTCISTSAPTANIGVNYYLELEQIKLDLNEATVATLKDMRGSN